VCGYNAHQALEGVWQGLMSQAGGWVIDLDIQSFFDSVDHKQLRGVIETRVHDGVIRRVLGKWLNAGVMESDAVHYPDRGTPQGGVISPLLANIYLHDVLDQWFETTVKPRLSGRAFMVRYADDAVLAFAREDEARRTRAVLAKRLAKYGLPLHPDKTRLVDFRPPGNRSNGGPKGQSFDLLGFTHHWGISRKGRPVVVRKTAKDRMGNALKRIAQGVRAHASLAARATTLGAKPKSGRSLRLLRDYRQRPRAQPVPPTGGTALALLAEPSIPKSVFNLAALQAAVSNLSLAPTARGT
jgi:hypothetical protein